MLKNIGIVWLWYVGLPLAYHFAKKWYSVVGFDISQRRLSELKEWIDTTHEIGDKIKDADILYTSDPSSLKSMECIIVTVPTPITENKDPDYTPLIKASEMIGSILQPWQIVVYESTVDPGATEEICLPVLERVSGLSCPKDFTIWYSPERINPGDKEHTVDKIAKVVGAIDENTLSIVSEMYGSIINATIHKAPSIKVAEASKIIENTQRDINIWFINELSQICDKLWINTFDVIEAASTKWNFLRFTPGLVGGHCIGVDPYYLAKRAQKLGLNPELILAWRRTNDGMGLYVAHHVIKMLIQANIKVQNAKVLVLWLTFKENVPDFRNSRIGDVIKELKEFGVEIEWYDPHSEQAHDHILHELSLSKNEVVRSLAPASYNGIIYAQDHAEFSSIDIASLLKDDGILFDIKGKFRKAGFTHYKSL